MLTLPNLKYADGDQLEADLSRMWAPLPDMTVTEWADTYRHLSPESAAKPGRYRSSNVPYQRGPMDAWTDRRVRKITIVCSVQVGKTTIGENCIGRAMHLAPGPMLVICPKHDKCEEYSKERLDPMFRDTPALRDLVAQKRGRESQNTIFRKMFRGGLLSLGSSRVAVDLASRPILYIIGEELDFWEESANGGGNPLAQVEKRNIWFHNSKRLISGSPGNKATSLIWPEFLDSDQRYYYVPCPHCGEFHVLEWENLSWSEDPHGEPIPGTARFHCPKCGAAYSDADKPSMLRAGEWRATGQFRGHAGFHVWAAYSPRVTFDELVQDWHKAKDNPRDLQVHWNTIRGLPWEGRGSTLEWEEVFDGRVPCEAEVPGGVAGLFAGVDTQNDRFEVTIYGASATDGGWIIDHRVIPGDPLEPGTREKLDEVLFGTTWSDEAGLEYPVLFTAIDTGGLRTQTIYQYCKARTRRGVIGIKGEDGENRPLIKAPVRKRVKAGDKGYKVWIVGTYGAKSEIYYRLSKDEEGGRIYVPARSPFDEQYCRGLTSEECVVTQASNGKRRVEWKKRRGRRRNEPLDCLVAALAARAAWPGDLKKYQAQREAEGKRSRGDGGDQGGQQKPARKPRRPGGWVNGWRK